MNERSDEFIQNSIAETQSVSSDRRSIGSVASTTGASSYESAVQEHEDYSGTKLPRPGQVASRHSYNMSGQANDPTSRKGEASGSGQGLGRSQSLSDISRSANTRRRDKAAVGYACQNCKKAHLACDVERPCRRCVQMGRASTCADVPHKRRGRPRLRDMQQQLSTIQATGPSSPPRAIIPSSPILMRRAPGHSRTGSISSPYLDHMNTPSISNPWARSPLQQSRRQFQPVGMHTHSRQVSAVPESLMAIPQSSMAYQGSSTAEPYRTASATLFVSIDMIIIRALQDVKSFFYAEPSEIEGRNITELVQLEDRPRIPQLVRALHEDVQTNRLLFSAHQHRQPLQNDLLPYSNTDLSHPFPGATEHLLGLTFIDALNRPITSRMAAVIGSRSNDRFAYVIVSIQRHDAAFTPPTPIGSMPSSSPRNYEAMPYYMGSPELEYRQPAAISGSIPQRSPAFPSRQMPPGGVVNPSPGSQLPRSIPQGYVAAVPPPPTTNLGRSLGPTGLGLNVLPPLLQGIPAQDAPARSTTFTTTNAPFQRQSTPPPSQQQQEQERRQEQQARQGPDQGDRRALNSASKRTSMSLSEMID